MSDQFPSYPGEQPGGQVPPPGAPQPGAYPTGGQSPAYSGQPPVPSKRPGVVTAAAAITIVLSVLSVLGGLLFVVANGPLTDYVRENPEVLDGYSESQRQDVLDNLGSGLVSAGVITIVIGAIGVVLGLLVLKPRPWARILLAVASGLSVLLGLLFSLTLIGIPWLIGSIMVLVFLFLGKSNDWFAGRPVRG